MLNLVFVTLVGVFLFVSAWSLYNLPILAAGVRHLRMKRKACERMVCGRDGEFPSFSIVVPVKNEERVIGRFLDAVAGLNYPKDKVELIIVEDGSTDKTAEVCVDSARRHRLNVNFLHKGSSDGKPSALNYGISRAKGEIIAVFDSDSVPAGDVLLRVCGYFEDLGVAAVQGRTLSINSGENMLTKFISYEEAVWCEAYLQGKDDLSLFVHLKGSCQFIRRDVLERLNGFDEGFLSEDMELSARLTEEGYRIRYASDVRCLQESPAKLKQLLGQRSRWYRGTMEVAFKYGRLMAKPSRRSLDAEATLLGPFVLVLSLLTYVVAFGSFFASYSFGWLWQAVMQFSALSTTLTLLVCGLALVFASKPRRVSSVLWLPFIYFYWGLQTFIALYAVVLIVLRRPRRWVKTEKSGRIAGCRVFSEK